MTYPALTIEDDSGEQPVRYASEAADRVKLAFSIYDVDRLTFDRRDDTLSSRRKARLLDTLRETPPDDRDLQRVAERHGARYLMVLYLIDGRYQPGRTVWREVMPDARGISGAASPAPYYEEARPRRRLQRNAARHRPSFEQRELARRERERQETQSATAALLAAHERERAATEAAHERERQAIERARERELQHERDMAEQRVALARLEARLAQPAAPAVEPETQAVMMLLQDSGVRERAVNKIIGMTSDEPTPWWGSLIERGVDMVADFVPTVGGAVVEKLIAGAAQKHGQQLATQQPNGMHPQAQPNGMHPQGVTAPASAPVLAANTEQPAPTQPASPRNYEEASAVVLHNIIADMDKSARVHGSARDVMALVRQYPQEAAQFLDSFKYPTAMILQIIGAQFPDTKEIVSREGSAAWFDDLKAEVARRLEKQAKPETPAAMTVQTVAASSNGNGSPAVATSGATTT